MKTKQEYIDALNRMEGVYYNFDGCMSSMNKFKEDINLLTGLVNEHFEEKQETNYEHFKDEIIENSGLCFALADGKLCQCSGISCSECGFSTSYGCSEKSKEWLKKPYQKQTYKLTKFENDLLQSYLKSSLLSGYEFKSIVILKRMKGKGYFKGVDEDATIEDILADCEVVG